MVRKVTTTTLPKCENALECLEHPRAITHYSFKKKSTLIITHYKSKEKGNNNDV